MLQYQPMIGPEPAPLDLGAAYGESRDRLARVVAGASDPPGVAVPACPGWSVHDVVSHLVAVAEDVLAGRLTAPPDDRTTAEQVARRRDRPTGEVLGEWAALSPRIEDLLRGVTIWPAVMDVLSHEHDVRAALGVPGGRDLPVISIAAARMLSWYNPPVGLTVRVAGETFEHRPDGDPGLVLDTDPFEVLRFRLGRRSRRQLASMAWTGDPSPVLDSLTVFGPSPLDIVE